MKNPKKNIIKKPIHLRERKKALEAGMAKNNSARILPKNFDFDLQELLDKSLLFDLRKTSKEKIFDAILEKIPDDDMYYIERREGKNTFRIRRDKKQGEKDDIITVIEEVDGKINKTTNKSRLSQLKRIILVLMTKKLKF